MFSLQTSVALTVLAFTGFVQAQLTGSTGPTTPLSSKTVTCSVLDYGGSVGSSDIGPAISEAFEVRFLDSWILPYMFFPWPISCVS